MAGFSPANAPKEIPDMTWVDLFNPDKVVNLCGRVDTVRNLTKGYRETKEWLRTASTEERANFGFPKRRWYSRWFPTAGI